MNLRQGLSGTATFYIKCGVVVVLLLALYWQTFQGLYTSWMLVDSYYLHGFLIPPISLYLAWKQRQALLNAPLQPSNWGCAVVAASCLLLVGSDFLGLRVVGQASLVPMLAGLIWTFLGRRHLAILWFPLVFLLFMVPIPPSITQSIALRVKLVATESAVRLAHAMTLPVIQEGSYVYFPNDKLLVGEVCGGLRSLVALLSFGALAGYVSRTRPWARLLLFLVSGPVAVIANILRILFLCVVAYFWGSDIATGKVHDISGILIFMVAFALLFAFDALLRRIAPAGVPPEDQP